MSASTESTAPFGHARTVTVDDLTFDVATAGPDDGAPVMLLHGFPESNAQWRFVAAQLADAVPRERSLRGPRITGALVDDVDEAVGLGGRGGGGGRVGMCGHESVTCVGYMSHRFSGSGRIGQGCPEPPGEPRPSHPTARWPAWPARSK